MAMLATDTQNSKVIGKPRRGFAAALSLPIEQTCPDSCNLKKTKECYAQGGRQAIHVRRLEKQYDGWTDLEISRAAAQEIETAAGQGLAAGRILRLFVSGDARTPAAARTIAAAARTWNRRGGRSWGYTHAWAVVPRQAWAGVSILASVESSADAKRARKRGYVPARIVDSHPANGKAWTEDGVTYIPCPEQTRGVPCVACGLCLDVDALAARDAAIAFAIHGQKANALKRRLPMLQTGKVRAA